MAEQESKKAAKGDKLRRQDKLRGQFNALILQNPNYFGNLPDSIFPPELEIIGNTTYEEIGCVGYHPALEKIGAVVYLNRKTGYGGDICTDGSTEYVRFYLSFDGGATWEDQGMSSFSAYDIAENETRLEYAVSKRLDPDRRFCFIPNLILARAILSWNVPPPPNTPDFDPVWGNRHDTHIEVEGFKFIFLPEIFKALEVELPKQLPLVIDVDEPLQAAAKELTLAEKADLYRDTDVEPARFAFPELAAKVAQPSVSENLMSSEFTGLFPDLDIDLPDIGDLVFPTDGSTAFEELECIGYDPRKDELIGIVRQKRGGGYSGGPCTAGSQEYVTFWADLNNNGFYETCLGTASVGVHDYGDDIPEEGLEYSVHLQTDLQQHQQPCEDGPVLIPIRAILSWAVPAPCFNPNWIPTWGNREQTIVHVYPGDVVDGKLPVISSVGDMATPDINGSGYATGIGVETGFVAENSPFGGRIDVAGKIVGGDAATKYRVMAKPAGAPVTDFTPITVEPAGLRLTLVTVVGMSVTIDPNHVVHADADGYYQYEDYSSSHFVDGNILMRWFTGAAEQGQAFDIRVDVSIDGNPANDVHSDIVTVRVDNEAPDVSLDIALGGGVDCADFASGAVFNGNFSATDEHFRRFWFEILPPGPANGVLPTPASGSSVEVVGGTIADPGVVADTYTLDTTGMDPCGYSLSLWAESRTNVNSGVNRHRSRDSVGFCVREE